MGKMKPRQKITHTEVVKCAHKNIRFLPNQFLKAICQDCGQMLTISVENKPEQ